jgi:hypothetical protein
MKHFTDINSQKSHLLYTIAIGMDSRYFMSAKNMTVILIQAVHCALLISSG